MNGYRWKALLVFLAVAVFAVLALDEISPLTAAEENREGNELPGYYKFFMKSGDKTSIPAERERDELIEQGKLNPVHIGKPIEDIKLPDGFGNTIGLRDYIGKKNVVLTTFRTWW